MVIDFTIEEFAVKHLHELNGKSIAESKIR